MTSFLISAPEFIGICAVVKIGFNPEMPATNKQMVLSAHDTLTHDFPMDSVHGKVVLLNGACSLPVGAVLIHGFAHVARAIGVYDPKLAAYVIAVTHDPEILLASLYTTEPLAANEIDATTIGIK